MLDKLKGSERIMKQELMNMGIVLVVSGIIALALLAYLFYVLFRGEEL